jgi:hypothetical protein
MHPVASSASRAAAAALQGPAVADARAAQALTSLSLPAEAMAGLEAAPREEDGESESEDGPG